jgi:excisionase family DNA binding protein
MPYLTFKDIAKELNVSLRTVSRMVADGLPVIHVHGRVYRVQRDALDQFLKQRTRVESPPDTAWCRAYSSRYNSAEIELLAMRKKGRQNNKRGSTSN